MFTAILLYVFVGALLAATLWYRDDPMMRKNPIRSAALLTGLYPVWLVLLLVDRFQRRRRKPRVKRRSRKPKS